jgi:hypothetical protein
MLVQSACGGKFGRMTDANGPDSPSAPATPATVSPSSPSSGSSPFVYYFADSGAIKAVPAGGGPPTVLFQGDANRGSLAKLAFDTQGVYFSLSHSTTTGASGRATRFSLNTLPAGGGPVTTLATGLDPVDDMARSGAYLYFVTQNRSDSNDGNGNPLASIERIPVAGGAAETLTTVAKSVHEIIADSSYVYWTQDDPASPNAPVVGEVMRMLLAGATPETLAQGQHRPFAITVDSNGLYWTDQGTSDAMHICSLTDGSVMTLDASTGSPVTLASGLVAVASLATQGGDVYWSILNTNCRMAIGAVFQRNGATGSTRTRAMALLPGNLYVDSTTLYFTSAADAANPVFSVTALPR